MKKIHCIAVIIITACFSELTVQNSTTPELSLEEVLRKLKSAENSLRDLLDSAIKLALPLVVKVSEEIEISSDCTEYLTKTIYALRNLESWAVKILDAQGKIPAGILSGVLGHNGDFDECISTMFPESRSSNSEQVRGQYCPVYMRPQLPQNLDLRKVTSKTNLFPKRSLYFSNESVMQELLDRIPMFYRFHIRQGLCIPSSCSAQEIQQIASVAVRDYGWEAQVPYCIAESTRNLSSTQLAIIVIFSVLFMMEVLATLADIILKRPTNTSRLLKCVLAFSFRRNFLALTSVQDNRENSLHFLDGLKVLTMLWIVLSHTYGFVHPYGSSGILNMEAMLQHHLFQGIANSWVLVETFFVIGGFLASQSILRILKGPTGLSLKTLYFRRVFRLWPALLFVLGLMFLLPLLGSGPLFLETFQRETEVCKHTWWASVFLLNSWLGYDQMCLVHSWYVSADIQLYIISPLFIYVYHRSKYAGLMLCFLISLVVTAWVAIDTYTHALPPSIIFGAIDEQFMKNGMQHSYFRPYCHLVPHIIGIVLGCLTSEVKSAQLKWWQRSLGWLLALSLWMAALLTPYPWHMGHLPDVTIAALYQSLHKTAWALATAWLIFSCLYGHSRPVEKFLSLPLWKPFSKLVYSVYLINMPVIWFRIASIRGQVFVGHYNLVYEFFGNIVVSIVLSVFMYIFVEAPFANLVDIALPGGKNNPADNKARRKQL